ncbi:hypothetical protein [Arundinibacter roseus]|uniref:Thioredoxin domain-containing protein n=1 Tax=Arundinibacter roseus TaxID=2070510 RepID=A0A4R4K6N1_9BACT|nr:hypothetical protein [Arundinibacter roseus]TDB62362.1 hypothetical protein EZE20_18445 [Arundinibacter roseus]
MKKYFLTWIFTATFLISGIIPAFAQPDSVVITGRIQNLTPALYRQAPVLTFTRNNLLQPQSELTRLAPLQADGSFRVALPLIYPQEEVYLDYGGKVYTTFLASPGTVQLTFDADSLYNASRLFYFAGVNAQANNQYIQYLAEEARLFKENKRNGEAFMNTFFHLNPSEAQRALERRAELRLSALLVLSQTGGAAPELRNWINSVVLDEQLTLLYDYSLANDVAVSAIKDSLNRLTQGVMSFQRVQWMDRLGEYADRQMEKKLFYNPTQAKSLPITKLATLLKTYGRELSVADLQRLDAIIEEGSATSEGLDFLSALYRKNRRTMDLLTMIEKKDRTFDEELGASAAALLNARAFVQGFYELSLDEKTLLHTYLQEKINERTTQLSLDELYQLEVKDSVYIKAVQHRNDLKAAPTEVLSGIWMAKSEQNGGSWFNDIQKLYQGKTLYVIKWNLLDQASRSQILYAPALRAQLPADVEFLYVHLPNAELNDKEDLWKQYIVRNKIKGIHLYINESQATQLLFKLNPLAFPSFAIIRPNGKYFSRNAPAPDNGQQAAEALLKARQTR